MLGVVGKAPEAGSFDAMLAEWRYSLRAEGLSPRTIGQYGGEAMGAFRRLLGEEPATVGRADVRRALLELMESRSRRTTSNYGQAWRKLFRWLVAEGMIGVDPMEGVKLPQPELPDVAVIPDEAIEAMLGTTHGGKGRFEDARDFAIMRVLLSGGPRAAEVRGMRLGDVNLDAGEIAVVGKGRKRRAVPLSDKACVALARYLRVRGRSPYAASSDALWLTRWGALTKGGLEKMLQRRARQAGLDESLTTPHKWRHTVASAWLEAGGQEGDLMRVMGWSERKMLDRYGRFTAGRRAMLAHRALKHDKW